MRQVSLVGTSSVQARNLWDAGGERRLTSVLVARVGQVPYAFLYLLLHRR